MFLRGGADMADIRWQFAAMAGYAALDVRRGWLLQFTLVDERSGRKSQVDSKSRSTPRSINCSVDIA